MSWATIVLLTSVAMVLIAVDFYLPGFVLGSIGVLLMFVAIWIAWKLGGLGAAGATLIVEVAV